MPYDLGLGRYGIYVVVFNTHRDAVPAFTSSGLWVGEADPPRRDR
ncbi:hypothetical protein ACFYV5_30735 [Streptomyces sp. NPDC003035]